MKCEYCRKEAYTAHVCPYCGGHYCSEHGDPARHDCALCIARKRAFNSDEPTKKKPWKLVVHFTFLENKNVKSTPKSARKKEQSPQPPTIETEKPKNFAVFCTKQANQQRPNSTPAEPSKPSSHVDELSKKTLTYYPTFLVGARKKFFAAAFALVVAEEILRLVSYATSPPFSAYLDGNMYVKILYQAVTPYMASLIVFVLVCLLLFTTTRLASYSQSTNNLRVSLIKGAIPIAIFTVVSATYILSIINWIRILTF